MEEKTLSAIENLTRASKAKNTLEFWESIDYKALYLCYKNQFKKFTFEHTREENISILREIISYQLIKFLLDSNPELDKKGNVPLNDYWNALKSKDDLVKNLDEYLKSLPISYSYYIGYEKIGEEDLFKEIDFKLVNDYSLQGISSNISKMDLSPTNNYGIMYQYLNILEGNHFKSGKYLALKGQFLGYLPYEKDFYRLEEELNKLFALLILIDVFRIKTIGEIDTLQKIIYFDDKGTMKQKVVSSETSSLLQNLELNTHLQYISKDLIDELFDKSKEFKQKPLNLRIKEVIDAHSAIFEKILDKSNNQEEIVTFRNLLSIYTQILGSSKKNIKYILLISLLENLIKLNGAFEPNLQVDMDTVNMVICNKKKDTLLEKKALKEIIEKVYHERNAIVHQANNSTDLDDSFYKVLFIATSLMQDFIKIIPGK